MRLLCKRGVHTSRVHRGNMCTWFVHRPDMPDWTLQTCTVPTGRTRVLYIVLHTCTARTHACRQYTRILCTRNLHILYVVMCTKHTYMDTHTHGNTLRLQQAWLSCCLCLSCALRPRCGLHSMGTCFTQSTCTLDTTYDPYTYPEQIHSENTPCLPRRASV